MNPNTPRPGHLFFTPRTPWGTRAGQQTFRQHQRASEDKKPDPASKEMQGLGGQMAPNQLTGAGGQPAKTDSSEWKMPHTDLQPHQPQTTATRTENKPQPFGEWARSDYYRQLSHLYFEAGYGGSHPGTEDKPEKTAGVGFATNSNMRMEMPFSEPNAAATPNVTPKGGEKDMENWKDANPHRTYNPERNGEEAPPPEALKPTPPVPQSLHKNPWRPPQSLKPTVQPPPYRR